MPRRLACAVVVLASLPCLSCGLSGGSRFAALVDEYLNQFAERHPSIAAGNGLHAHDASLEDFSAAAVATEVDWLRAFRTRLDAVNPSSLTPDDRVDRRILLGIVDGWLLDLDGVKTWTRNPMIYASAISDGVHNLMTMESSPAPDRMKQAAAKLHGVPRLLAAARQNLTAPVQIGRASCRERVWASGG